MPILKPRKKNTSITWNLSLWVVFGIGGLWLLVASVAWYESQHELSEIVQMIPPQALNPEGESAAQERQEILDNLMLHLFGPIFIGLIALGLLVLLGIRHTVRPLRSLAHEIATRKPDALQTIETDSIPKEVLPVVQEMNHLFGRVARSIAAEKRFTEDAAHELRTPLATIRMQAQVAHLSTDPQEQKTALTNLLHSCDRSAHLLEQLLLLARLDQNQTPTTDISAINLDQTLRTTLADLLSRPSPAAAQRHEWELLGLERLPTVMGNPYLASIVLRNLFDNAMRYTPPGLKIRATANPAYTYQPKNDAPNLQPQRYVELRIEDDGPGMSAAELERLGERFFRANPSAAPGSGLGWSIIQKATWAQGWKISVGPSAALQGLCVTLTIPEAPPLSQQNARA